MTLLRKMGLVDLDTRRKRALFAIAGPEKWETGDGPFEFSCRGELPHGLAQDRFYWIMPVVASLGVYPTLYTFAASEEDAKNEVFVPITSYGDESVPLWIKLPDKTHE